MRLVVHISNTATSPSSPVQLQNSFNCQSKGKFGQVPQPTYYFKFMGNLTGANLVRFPNPLATSNSWLLGNLTGTNLARSLGFKNILQTQRTSWVEYLYPMAPLLTLNNLKYVFTNFLM